MKQRWISLNKIQEYAIINCNNLLKARKLGGCNMHESDVRKRVTTNKGCGCGCVGVVIIALVIIIGIVITCTNYYSTKTYTATVTDKFVKNYEENSTYLVATELEDGTTRVFSVEDTLIKWRWNSSDVYAQIKVGKTYKFEVIGWRIGFFSKYENVITFSEVDSLSTNVDG